MTHNYASMKLQDLIDVTSVVHYENFRARKLSNVMSSKLTGKSPMAQVIKINIIKINIIKNRWTKKKENIN